VLTTVLVMNFVGTRERARDAQKIQDLNSLKSALRMYYNDNQTYPLYKSSLQANLVTGGYIASLGDTGFNYTQTDSGDGFRLTISLEVGAGNDDLSSQTNCGISPTVDKTYAVCAK
jgi:type II secretory pathway pseudopilin PulG